MSDFNAADVNINVNVDERAATAAANRLGDILVGKLDDQFARLGKDISDALAKSLGQVRRTAADFQDLGDSASRARSSFSGFGTEASDLEQDLAALERRTEATKRALSA